MNSVKLQKIIIRTPNWLGDLMMATAFIKAVLDSYPHAQVDLIVKSGFEKLPLPHRGRIWVFDKNRNSSGAFGKSLRADEYDDFYILPPSFSSAWMAFCSGSKKRIGYGGNLRNWLLRPVKHYEHSPRTQHLVKEYFSLLDMPFSFKRHFPKLDISPEWVENQLQGYKELPEGYIAVAPGAIYGAAKQWPVQHYQALVELLRAHQYPIIVLGTEADHEDGETICQQREGVYNWCGKSSLTELVALLAKARLLVSNDSGSMHIMAALQRPQVAIFGSTSLTWTSPLNSSAHVVYLNLSCSPCFQRICPYHHYDCLWKITPEQVFQEALSLLRKA
ncbi:MAG: lipopolysaccharide heptosyltransferase II [SAR324 cluster bacterium]|nr:lipopolysaccharide heptosyltransferase II [SAR324 cluster bacterium]